jgi:hypothetical protein
VDQSARADGGRSASRWIVPSFVFVALLALWVLAVGNVRPPEVVAGAVAAGLVTIAVERVRRTSSNRARIKLGWLAAGSRQLLHVPMGFVTITIALTHQLLGRRPGGRFQTLAFQVQGHDRWSVGRRVVALFALSLPPDSYVVGFDLERGTMLVHTLGRRLSEDDLPSLPSRP